MKNIFVLIALSTVLTNVFADEFLMTNIPTDSTLTILEPILIPANKLSVNLGSTPSDVYGIDKVECIIEMKGQSSKTRVISPDPEKVLRITSVSFEYYLPNRISKGLDRGVSLLVENSIVKSISCVGKSYSCVNRLSASLRDFENAIKNKLRLE